MKSNFIDKTTGGLIWQPVNSTIEKKDLHTKINMSFTRTNGKDNKHAMQDLRTKINVIHENGKDNKHEMQDLHTKINVIHENGKDNKHAMQDLHTKINVIHENEWQR
jgi:predicted  nucleic acid-binding Zn-ribbon protein